MKEKMSRSLGWFSIGLGSEDGLTPKKNNRSTGIKKRSQCIQTSGLHKLASGTTSLRQHRATAGAWPGVTENPATTTQLPIAFGRERGERGWEITATHAVAEITAFDFVAAQKIDKRAS